MKISDDHTESVLVSRHISTGWNTKQLPKTRHQLRLTFEVAVSPTGLTTLLDAVPGNPASQGLAGTGQGMELLAQLRLHHKSGMSDGVSL